MKSIFVGLLLGLMVIGFQNCAGDMSTLTSGSRVGPDPEVTTCNGTDAICVRINSNFGYSPITLTPEDVPAQISFSTEITGGTGSLTYSWSNCTPVQNDPSRCSRAQNANPGAYTVSVTVTDSLGESASSQFTINVQDDDVPPPPPPSGNEVRSLEMGTFNSCAIMADTTLKCWGSNFRIGNGVQVGSTTRPTKVNGLSNVLQVSIGETHTCALIGVQGQGGTVKCWGENYAGQIGNGTTQVALTPQSVVGLSDVKMIGVGWDHSCALLYDNSVKCWGGNAGGQLGNGSFSSGSSHVPSPTPTNVVGLNNLVIDSIASGGSQNCVVLNGGTARCWGVNTGSVITEGSNSYRQASPTPVAVENLNNVKAMSIGGQTCALLNDAAKTVMCRGRVFHGGDLGNRRSVRPHSATMTPVLTGVESISAGGEFGCALLTNKTVQCWGWNDLRQLGSSNQHNSSVPLTVNELTNVTKMSSGGTASCALREDKTVKCWGEHSQLPSVGIISSATPVSLAGSSSITKLSAGRRHSCAVYSDGSTKCWGMNEFGQLGNNSRGAIAKNPVTVQGLSNVQQLSLGEHHTCALTNGNVKCWGLNEVGQLGTGSTQDSLTPVQVPNLSGVLGIAAGTSHTCALLGTGDVKCWGWNAFGQLGNNNSNPDAYYSATPVSVVNLQGATAISGGFSYTCAIVQGGAVKCWGKNTDSFSGNGAVASSATSISNLSNVTAISAGAVSCALIQGGAVKCWGGNAYGQLGNGSNSDSLSSAVSVSNISNATKISANSVHACATLTDGVTKCWGNNYFNQLGSGNQSTASNVPVTIQGLQGTTDVASGWNSACAKESSGYKCWGWNAFYQLGIGPDTSGAVLVSFQN